ncbi:tripartite tricarboxylate transporter substrate binding protein [Bacillus sp. RAR_GA_16]|uniref:tripartite tricarboxylate transporter substrate binding protein n=1 Tax=Bacillus sp. RAR_GA_16 TaxID=2876774 RepID=UPI001CCFC1F7|nr:tripartite tricarboxylate transporter substrate binding protein [Bacillus sp. RAR_GA_16]MCA0174558.1 tripartite tricarboxylate transporter substrate binding protein [Bacillus sp. RAR_GA_16]
MMGKASLTAFLLLLVLVISACSQLGSSDEVSSEAIKEYPNTDIRNIVPFSAGGTTDVNQRLIESFWKEHFPENMVIEYYAGAGGEVGFTELAKAKPDGYTMGSINTPHIILQPLGRPTQFEYDSFNVLARLVHDPQVLAVKADSKIQNLDQFIESVKDKPGSLSVGLTGTLTGDHLTTLKFMDAADVEVTMVPLAGSSDQVKELLGGHIDAIMGNVGDVTKDIDQFKVLAIATDERHEWLPDVPTFKEQDIDLVAAIDRGLALPKGTPKEIEEKLFKSLEEITSLPEYKKKMKEAGLVEGFMPGDEWTEIISEQKNEAEKILKKYDQIKK